MYRLTIALFACAILLTAIDGQEPAPLKLTRVCGVDGKPWPIKVARRGTGPEIETFDGPYVLTPGATRPALWYLDGETCTPVAFSPVGRRFGNFEVVHSGAEYFLTYTVDGVNEFWRLTGDKAAQVTLDSKPFSQRARITRSGATAFLYQGSADGKTSLFELKDGAAVAVQVDDADHGTISYAWQVGGKLLAAFYFAGTYDFHLLSDGKFTPVWERNGEKTYERQVDSISEIRAGERLFFSMARRDKTSDTWVWDGATLMAVLDGKSSPDLATQAFAANSHGLYFVSAGKVLLAEGRDLRPIKLDQAAETITCKGGSVLVRSKTAAWLVTGREVAALEAADSDLVAHVAGADLLRSPAGVSVYREGRVEGSVDGVPANFGLPVSTWTQGTSAYLLERTTAESPEFRLWVVR